MTLIMASVLQHQVESRVNDLYLKMQNHAKLIMRLAVEVDNLKKENELYKSIISDHESVIEGMINDIPHKSENKDVSDMNIQSRIENHSDISIDKQLIQESTRNISMDINTTK
jgi:hypothetical protein